jgi:hypothetical protein
LRRTKKKNLIGFIIKMKTLMRLNMEEKHRVRGLKTSKKGKNDKDIKPLKM